MADEVKKLYVKNGGIWKKDEGKMSGSIEVEGQKVNFSIFSNTYKKEGDKQPDYVLSWKLEGLPECLVPAEKTKVAKEETISIEDVGF